MKFLFNNAELALASYQSLFTGATRDQRSQLVNRDAMSSRQAEEFVRRYPTVVTQYDDATAAEGHGTSFSATVFRDASGNHTLAIRGTLELAGSPNDASTDIDIWQRGAGYDQIVAMVNWWQRETASAGQMVQQYEVRSFLDGHETVPDGAVFLYSDPLFDNTGLPIGRSFYLVETADATATGGLESLAAESVAVTGHSLGGHLAMAFGALFAQNTAGVTAFNAPGFLDNTTNQDFFSALGGSVPGGVATTNIIADQAQVGKKPWNAIAGFHNRPGTAVDIPIEDQWLSDEPDTTSALNHSQQTLTDALAVYAKLTEYDPSLNTEDFKAILASAVAGTAGGLERIVDGLQELFQGETPPLAVGNANRDQLYQALFDLPEGTGGNPIIALDGLSAAELAARAQTDIAYRYALATLNPFAVTGNDALYASLPEAAEPALYDPAAGTGSITSNWLSDRAELLTRMLEANRLDSGFITGTGELFQAADDEGTMVLTTGDVGSLGGSVEQTVQYKFGSEDGEAISGGERDDWLYGMGGDDTLTGGGGADRLEGGEGYDSYNSSDGDVILDTDGSGKVLFEDQLLSGGVDEDADGIYENDGGEIQYSLNGTTLSVTHAVSNATLIIEDFANLELGIDLSQDQPDDGSTQFSQHVGTISDERIDGDQGNNIISGIDGQDILTGSHGGDRIFSELEIDAQSAIDAAQTMPGTEARGDFLDGRKGDDLLVGSPDRDVLAGGLGNDTLVGGGGKDFIDGDREGWRVQSEWEFSVSTAGSSIVPAANNFSLIHAESTPGEGHDRIYGGMGEDFILGQTGNDVIDAGAGDDVVDAGEGDDTIYGRTGSDLLFADGDYTPSGHGNDYINGGEGPDGIYGQGGRDLLVGGEGDDYIRGDNRGFGSDIELIPVQYHGGDTLLGGLGIDTLYGDGGDDFIAGGADSDVIFGDDPFTSDAYAGNDVLSGGDGADLIVGQNGNDILYGGNGDDGGSDAARLVGGAGNDILYGDSGDDYLFGDADDVDASNHGNDRLFGGADDDVLIGHGGDDHLDGGAGADELYGDEGADVLLGGAGDDRLKGGSGADILDGGEGNDVLLVDAEDTVHWRAEPGTDFVVGDDALINLIGVDSSNITVTQAVDPSLGDLLVVNTGQSYLALVDGVLSANSSYSFSGEVLGQAELMRLASALDIDGTRGSDEIYGSDQADVIRGYDATAPDQDDGDVLFGQGGDDHLEGGAGNDRLDGGTGVDILVGGGGDDVFVVDDAADTVVESAASGDDTVESGIDYVLGADVENVILTGEAQTRATGNALANALTGNDTDNTLEGLAGDDSISGLAGGDILKGGYGEDGLSGGEGDDRLVGGFGNDILYGGAGADTYVFNPGEGQDVIVDADVGNTVEFGPSVNPADVSVSQYRGDDGSYYLKGVYAD
ncbi:MAG TPA: hypothetical protein VK971_01960 [Thiohalobacter sp.]|nr:hypothetical protein [Thiohalobacter sp.]